MFPETSKQVDPRIPKRVQLVLGIVLGVSFALFVAVDVSDDILATYVPTSEAWSWYQDKMVCPEMTSINITQLGAIAVINDLNHSLYIEWQNKGQVLRDTFLEAGQFSSYPSSLFQPIDIVWILDDVGCTYYIPDGIYNDMYRVSQIKDRCVRLTSTIPYMPDGIAYVQGIIQYTENGVNKILRTGHVGYDKTGTVAIPLNVTNFGAESATPEQLLGGQDHPEQALDENNLQSVCAVCHNRLHPEKGKPEQPIKPRKTRVLRSAANIEVR
jgi:hypothetical protein